jgi:hypothetical protein
MSTNLRLLLLLLLLGLLIIFCEKKYIYTEIFLIPFSLFFSCRRRLDSGWSPKRPLAGTFSIAMETGIAQPFLIKWKRASNKTNSFLPLTRIILILVQ